MPWRVIKHSAELALLLAVLNMFRDCHNLADVFQVVCAANEITRLGVVTASAIAASGLSEMLEALAHALHLPELLERIVGRTAATQSYEPGRFSDRRSSTA
jgi:hypothetical protein